MLIPLPLPVSVERLPGHATVGPDSVLHADETALSAASLLAEYLTDVLGKTPQISTTSGQIRLRIDALPHAIGNPEAYRLELAETHIDLTGSTPAGLRHAVQALRQLLPPELLGPRERRAPPASALHLPCVRILDAPRLAWRGLLLDVARHFTPVPGVLRLLDLMALHRLNILQLHLTDDQGWRLESPTYPRLTEIGGHRAAAPADPADPADPRDRATGPAHEGWYTKDDIREIVEYADRRGITVVPEIDVPGHVQAALAAYPYLGNDPDAEPPIGVWNRWGINTRLLNAEPSTIDFFTHVLDEVIELFPGPYVHIGGDECSPDEWLASAAARSRTRELGLDNPAQLYSWIMSSLANHLSARGRRPIGWDEIAASPIPPDAVVMSWHGREIAEAAAERGFDVVLAPADQTYFDLHQAADGEPRGQKGVLTLAESYAFDPFAGRFGHDLAHRLLGAQCQLWTEYIPTQAHLDYMAFPRVAAFAERAWGSEDDYAGFTERLEPHLERLSALGVAYRGPTSADRGSASADPFTPASSN